MHENERLDPPGNRAMRIDNVAFKMPGQESGGGRIGLPQEFGESRARKQRQQTQLRRNSSGATREVTTLKAVAEASVCSSTPRGRNCAVEARASASAIS